MSFKVLEQNGIDNENVDGGAFNRFTAGGRDGIIRGVLSDCALAAVGNGIGISPGEIIMCGIRVKITETETLFLSGSPITVMQYQIIAQATLQSNRSLFVSFLLRPSGALRQDSLYAAEQGVYEVEIGTFTHNIDGTISDLKQSLKLIDGGVGAIESFKVGSTITLPPGTPAYANNVGTDKDIVIDFGIPKGEHGDNFYSFSVDNGRLIVTSAIADANALSLKNGHIILG